MPLTKLGSHGRTTHPSLLTLRADTSRLAVVSEEQVARFREALLSVGLDFNQKYVLLDLVEDQNAQTYIARETATGKKVNVFLFPGDRIGANRELNRCGAERFFEIVIQRINCATLPSCRRNPAQEFR